MASVMVKDSARATATGWATATDWVTASDWGSESDSDSEWGLALESESVPNPE